MSKHRVGINLLHPRTAQLLFFLNCSTHWFMVLISQIISIDQSISMCTAKNKYTLLYFCNIVNGIVSQKAILMLNKEIYKIRGIISKKCFAIKSGSIQCEINKWTMSFFSSQTFLRDKTSVVSLFSEVLKSDLFGEISFLPSKLQALSSYLFQNNCNLQVIGRVKRTESPFHPSLWDTLYFSCIIFIYHFYCCATVNFYIFHQSS